jgi:hypothetical protein
MTFFAIRKKYLLKFAPLGESALPNRHERAKTALSFFIAKPPALTRLFLRIPVYALCQIAIKSASIMPPNGPASNLHSFSRLIPNRHQSFSRLV